jgi:tripartite-type tricarboxylate transporter receptor subunit TctC
MKISHEKPRGRRQVIKVGVAGVASCALALPLTPTALAQNKGPIKILVGFPPGGGTDAVARLFAEKLKDILGQPVVIENKSGAGGKLAVDALVAAPADGSVLMIAPNAVPTFQTLVLNDTFKYDVLKDMTPVAGLAAYPLGMAVSLEIGVKNATEFVAWAKANPSKASFGNAGAGGQTHFSGIQFGKVAGIKFEAVAYKGAAPMMTDLIAGHVPAGIGIIDSLIAQHRAGKIKLIGIFSAKRSPLLPDVPTFIEQGINLNTGDAWTQLWAPPKTPRAEVERLQEATRKALENADLREQFTAKLAVSPDFKTADQMAKMQADELALWAPIIKASGFKSTQ